MTVPRELVEALAEAARSIIKAQGWQTEGDFKRLEQALKPVEEALNDSC